MAVEDTWSGRPHGWGGDTGAIVTRPRLGLGDMLLQLWRAKWLMLLVFLPIFALGLSAAFSMPTRYEAYSRLLVSLGEEQVYRPRVGSEAAGAIPDQEQLIQAELELMRSPVVAERVLDRFDLVDLFPGIAAQREAIAQSSPNVDPDYTLRQLAIDSIMQNFGSGAPPKSSVIRTTFIHEQPDVAADVLNALVEEYLAYRSEVYLSSRPASFGEQREKFEADLLIVEGDIRQFLIDNDISDFEAERQAAQALYASVSDELFKASTRASAVRGQLGILTRQMGETDPLVDIFVEDSTDQTLLNLRIEREEALTKYKPDSRVVKAIDRRIEQVEAYLAGQAESIGTRRTGPNPIYQNMETRHSTLEAEAQSLTNQLAELQRQEEVTSDRLRRMADIEPQWLELQRKRDLIERNLSSFAERELESQTLSELAQQEADNIRVLEEARVPVAGSSLKLPVAALAFLAAAFTALIAGLLRALTRDGFSTAGSIERTTGLPVIASVRKRRG